MDIKIMPKRIRDSVYQILQELDNRMKNDTSTTFCDIYSGIQKVIELQKDYVRKPVNREQHMADLLEWATRNGVDCSCINIINYGEFGYGLQAAQGIKEGQEFLKIPMNLILSSRSFLESELGHLAKTVQSVPGMLLTLALLAEMGNPGSFWTPYFNSLPNAYNMVLYFTPEDMELLSETSMQSSASKFYQIALKQYIEIFKLMENEKYKLKLTPFRNFCFEDYRWAFCTVMTRQNTIRGEDWEEHAFIPLWDMCNHVWGQVSTSFVCCSEMILSQAMMEFKEGDQIFIHYGDRSLREMFLYGGYVLPGAPTTVVPVTFSMDNKVSDSVLKLQLLQHLNLPAQYSVDIGNILKPECLAYLRVYCMPKELLDKLTRNCEDVGLLREHFLWLSVQNELDVYVTLFRRCQLMKKNFKCQRETDLQMVADSKSSISREIYRLRAEEKAILDRFLDSCHNHLSFLYRCKVDFERAVNDVLKKLACDDREDGRPPFLCVNKTNCLNKNGDHACCHLDFDSKALLMPFKRKVAGTVEETKEENDFSHDEIANGFKDLDLERKGFKKSHLRRFCEESSEEKKASEPENSKLVSE